MAKIAVTSHSRKTQKKTNPKYEQGGNIDNVHSSVPQIQGQNNGNQSFEEDTEKDKPKYETRWYY